MSHNEGREKNPVERWGGYWVLASPRWWSGFVFMVVGGILGGTSLFLCPMGLIAPFAGVTIVTNALFAKWFLHEALANFEVNGHTVDVEVWGTAIIVVGTCCTAVFGPHEERSYSAKELSALFVEPLMALQYLIAAVVLSISVMIVRNGDYNRTWLEAVAYANMSGCIGANQNLFLKSVMELFREAAFLNPITYFMLFLTIAAVVLQLTTLNLGLARHPSVKYLPMYQSALVVYGVVTGGIFFKEFSHYSLATWIFTPLGISFIILGLWLFSLVPNEEPDPIEPQKINFCETPQNSPDDVKQYDLRQDVPLLKKASQEHF